MTEVNDKVPKTKIGRQLKSNRGFMIAEILLLFLSVFAFIKVLTPLAGENPLLRQFILWLANIFMLAYVWAGAKLRGENYSHFGLTLAYRSGKGILKTFLLSLLVFILAITGFLIGSIIMANITGIPEGADLSGYDFLKDNIGMLLLTLLGVYIVSSFGEEVIYRAFLINRISEVGRGTKKAVAFAVVLSSIIFGLVHYEWGPMGMVQTGCMGLVLGICYIKLKKQLWILILAHAYMDTLLMVQLYLASN